MRYLTFSSKDRPAEKSFGVLVEGANVIELSDVESENSLLEFIKAGSGRWRENSEKVQSGETEFKQHDLSTVTIHAPITRPPTLRDFYAFEQHVTTAYANRGRTVPNNWYEMPVFYFCNPNSTFGHDHEVPMPKYTRALDYELEVAAVIGKPGRDIPAKDAMQHIFGFTIFNDWSARDEQRKEMSVGLGPAKGKDFASSFGPYIVTPDELEDRREGRPGVYDLEMIARVNGKEYSRGNWSSLHYSFGEMIARASADVTLQPGDIIGSGTVGTGCLLELTKGEGPWLQIGDVVELEIERLGVLRNTVS
ncbi:MAG: fumarylacetoacetate hydrolase family protein [Chloroflexi bacterium]|nr:fumarylacetoacetate hydrolase family protein [Chloroflexota bacterium]